MKSIQDYFDENFKEGNRYNLVCKLSGTCAKLNIPIDGCISFYQQYRHLDDEDRTYLIKRAYERYESGQKVSSFKKDEVDLSSQFIIDPSDNKESLPNNLSAIQNKLNSFKQIKQQFVDINSISIPLLEYANIYSEYYNYIKGRGISNESIKRFDIRIGTGLLERRVVFPVYNKWNRCVYYVARAIDKDVKPKYINSKLPKESVIWNYYQCDLDKPVIVCEGIINAISAWEYTGIQSVAVLGKYVSEYQRVMLNRFRKLIFCFDGDVDDNFLRKSIFTDLTTEIEYVILPEDWMDANVLDRGEFLKFFKFRKRYLRRLWNNIIT